MTLIQKLRGRSCSLGLNERAAAALEAAEAMDKALEYTMAQCSNEECEQCQRSRQALANYRKATQ